MAEDTQFYASDGVLARRRGQQQTEVWRPTSKRWQPTSVIDTSTDATPIERDEAADMLPDDCGSEYLDAM